MEGDLMYGGALRAELGEFRCGDFMLGARAKELYCDCRLNSQYHHTYVQHNPDVVKQLRQNQIKQYSNIASRLNGISRGGAEFSSPAAREDVEALVMINLGAGYDPAFCIEVRWSAESRLGNFNSVRT